MPSRSLVAAAVIVWVIALLVAVLLGLPMLLTDVGVDVDAGLIINALAALGAFSAAAAAVWVATADRRERRDERNATDRAQASLVVAYVVATTGGISITVRNYGDRAILDVSYDNAWSKDFPSARFTPQQQWAHVLQPHRDYIHGMTFDVHAADQPTQEFMQSKFPPAVPPGTPVAAAVRFTDASGNHWHTAFELQGQGTTRADGSVVTVGSMRRLWLESV